MGVSMIEWKNRDPEVEKLLIGRCSKQEFKLAFRLMFFGCLNSQEAIEAQNMKLIYTSEAEIEFDGMKRPYRRAKLTRKGTKVLRFMLAHKTKRIIPTISYFVGNSPQPFDGQFVYSEKGMRWKLSSKTSRNLEAIQGNEGNM